MNVAICFLLLPVFVFAFGIIGAQEIAVSTTRLASILPILGFAYFIIATQIISTLTGLNVTRSGTYSFGILLATAIFQSRRIQKVRLVVIIRNLFFTSMLGEFVILFLSRSHSPFGTWNFDFVYALQDAKYTQVNPVFHHSSDVGSLISTFSANTFPLNWGAAPVGRYTATYLISVVQSYIGTPLEVALFTYVLMIVFNALAFYFLARNLITRRPQNAVLLSLIGILSPCALYGYHNQLLGQTSGLPIIVVLITLLLAREKIERYRRPIIDLLMALLFMAEFWIYPAQLFFMLPPIFLVFLVQALRSRDGRNFYKHLVFVPGAIVLIALLSVGRDFGVAYHRIGDLIFYSSRTAAKSHLYTAIFNQFSSYKGPLISLGFLGYPDTTNYFGLGYLILFLVFLLGILVINRNWKQKKFTFLQYLNRNIYYVIFLSYLILLYSYFFLTSSNYLLFKMSTWCTPVLLIFLLGKVFRLFKKGESHSETRQKFAIGILIGIFLSASVNLSSNHLQSAWAGADIPFANSKYALNKNFLRAIASAPGNIRINMPAMEEVAWVAENLPDKSRLKVSSVGTDQQSLWLGYNRGCTESKPFTPTDSVFQLIRNNDIFPDSKFIGAPAWKGNDFSQFNLNQISLLWAYGVGSFYPENVKYGPFGIDQPFRWTNGYFSSNVYSKFDQDLNLRFPVFRGTYGQSIKRFSTNNGEIRIEDLESNTPILVWRKIHLKSGSNCISFQAAPLPDIKFPGNSPRPDFRPITLAVGPIKVIS